jgi:hypothetical protein
MLRAVLNKAALNWSHGPLLRHLLPVAAAVVGVVAARRKPQPASRSRRASPGIADLGVIRPFQTFGIRR